VTARDSMGCIKTVRQSRAHWTPARWLLGLWLLGLWVLGCDPVISLGDAPLVSHGGVMASSNDAVTGREPVVPAACGGLVCDGLETTGSVEVAVDTEQGATFERVQEPTHTGEFAARFTTSAEQSWSAFVFRFDEPIVSPAVYVRMYLFVPSGTVTGRLNFLAIENEDTFNIDVNLLGAESGEVVFEVYNHSSRAGVSTADVTVPFDQWFCLQTAVVLSETAGQVLVSIDGREVLRTPNPENTLPSGGISKVGVGAFWTEAGQADSELFVDDIAIGQDVVSCL
jgi:hypothetical protein